MSTPTNEPTFYQLLQFDARGLWAKIRTSQSPRDKRRYFLAMTVRSLLLVAFAVLFIGVLTAVFGNGNSGVVVAGFCILLGIKFVAYGYRIDDSLFALAVVFACMFVGGLVTLASSPALIFIANLLLVAVILVLVANDPPMGNAGIYVFACMFVGGLVTLASSPALIFIANLLLVAVILVLVANDPPMGNAGIYVFSYLFISQTPVTGSALGARALLMLLLWVLCGAVLIHKHHAKFKDIRLAHLLQGVSLSSEKTQWQLRLATGVAGALLIGELLGIPRGVWVGYACMSVLLPYGDSGESSAKRAATRLGGVAVGSLAFNAFAALMPEGLLPLLGPLAGICIGFSSKYFWNNVLNCFGALLLASAVYGLEGSVALRIYDNLVGVVFAVVFTALLAYLEGRVEKAREGEKE